MPHDSASSPGSPRPLRFALLGGSAPFLELPRDEGLALLDWLGLGRPEFGALDARELLPLCRRRLWPEQRNLGSPRLWLLASELTRALEGGPGGLVHFG
jgi:hypothetical protein